MSNNVNPFSLFLILILLVLSTDSKADVKLGFVRGLIDQTSRSLGILREGITAMNTSFEQARSMFTSINNGPGDPK
ncbi:hypothetical protein [Desulfoscipio gibsoniae]|uniref:Uncharacterized protein n=1 Tax=Desulfoscipio gibsoniae DSM 7213 TaxID=767817 RepID=R4KM38_9FIRM|nr:hypothetical protein [Desulfoscipio gibsoniae]AGL02612.1 hypothetical protein Desgi_3266 [Desulfoscipio gibsoniae DSM 7213]